MERCRVRKHSGEESAWARLRATCKSLRAESLCAAAFHQEINNTITKKHKMRIPKYLLDEVIEHEGEVRTGPVSRMGVLRLALDLQDARKEIKRLTEDRSHKSYEKK